MMRRLFLILACAAFVASCSNLQSSVQSLITGEEVTDETYGGRQHFPVSPQRAVDALSAVAPQQGWEIVSTEDEYDSHGQHGKFFRMESRDVGDKKSISGVFYEEPKGSYVRISENNGLPEALVDALVAELKANKGYVK